MWSLRFEQVLNMLYLNRFENFTTRICKRFKHDVLQAFSFLASKHLRLVCFWLPTTHWGRGVTGSQWGKSNTLALATFHDVPSGFFQHFITAFGEHWVGIRFDLNHSVIEKFTKCTQCFPIAVWQAFLNELSKPIWKARTAIYKHF